MALKNFESFSGRTNMSGTIFTYIGVFAVSHFFVCHVLPWVEGER